MKYLTILFLLFCFSSCEYFEKKKITSQEILQEDLQTFNWNEVDEYPTFASCDSALSKAERKHCFETTLSSHIVSQLAKEKIVVTKDVNDTIVTKFLISDLGELSVLEVKSSELIKTHIPEIDSFLINSLKGLPKILPAFKRGQQVKTEFRIPIVIKVD